MSPRFMFPERLIIDRLRKGLPAQVAVLPAAELDGVLPEGQPAPAVYVVLTGVTLVVNGIYTEHIEQWTTLVVTRNASSAITGWDNRLEAGPLMEAVFELLNGWTPDLDGKRLQPVVSASARGPWYEDGFGNFPLAWEFRGPPVINPCPT